MRFVTGRFNLKGTNLLCAGEKEIHLLDVFVVIRKGMVEELIS